MNKYNIKVLKLNDFYLDNKEYIRNFKSVENNNLYKIYRFNIVNDPITNISTVTLYGIALYKYIKNEQI